jgi:hypothetical protein
LKFDTQSVVKALGTVNRGDVVVLRLTAKLLDGSTVSGEDVMLIVQ